MNKSDLIGKKWGEISEDVQEFLMGNAVPWLDYSLANYKEIGEHLCIIDLTECLSVEGYYVVTEDENYIFIKEDAVIYSN